ncbi:hypothetical protein LCGC14_0162900, partial [marine sediment metagenome]
MRVSPDDKSKKKQDAFDALSAMASGEEPAPPEAPAPKSPTIQEPRPSMSTAKPLTRAAQLLGRSFFRRATAS